MEHPSGPHASGACDARYRAFLETIVPLRPSLHRYCARMTGSALDGEDIVQESLFQAYRKLDTFDEQRPLTPWLFRIAHNRCIDFLRRREVRQDAEAGAASEPVVSSIEPLPSEVGEAVEYLVLALPPMERACVLLKDVFDYSLEEIADLVDSTVGGVKAALSRGRTKLAAVHQRPPAPPSKTSRKSAEILRLYVERFNRQDWDGLRELISADARLVVADAFVGPLRESPYFSRYQASAGTWRVTLGEADGEPVVIVLRLHGADWKPASLIRLSLSGEHIVDVKDYFHCPWLLPALRDFVVSR